jgi:hypothetical protein
VPSSVAGECHGRRGPPWVVQLTQSSGLADCMNIHSSRSLARRDTATSPRARPSELNAGPGGAPVPKVPHTFSILDGDLDKLPGTTLRRPMPARHWTVPISTCSRRRRSCLSTHATRSPQDLQCPIMRLHICRHSDEVNVSSHLSKNSTSRFCRAQAITLQASLRLDFFSPALRLTGCIYPA